MEYNPDDRERLTTEIGAPTQDYDLTDVLNDIGGVLGFDQQCDENADLLAIFAHSLGIDMDPIYLEHINAHNGVGLQVTYLPAGRGANEDREFSYHSVGLYDGTVYDPSTGAPLPGNAAREPRILGFAEYLNQAFGLMPADVKVDTVTRIEPR